MTPDQVRKMQGRLVVPVDGDLGAWTLVALFMRMGAGAQRAADLSVNAATTLAQYGVLDAPLRLVHFIAQAAHESGGFRYMEEIGGPAYFAKYDGRAGLGNVHPGDGALFHGRGLFQLTGRTNYRVYGAALGLDLEHHPDLAAAPTTGLLIACKFWQDHGLNRFADLDDIYSITRRINGGLNGIDDRKARLALAKGLLL